MWYQKYNNQLKIFPIPKNSSDKIYVQYYKISDKDRIFLSGYFGRDVLGLENPNRNLNLNMLWGNATATLRWNHLFNDKLFMNAMLIFNDI